MSVSVGLVKKAIQQANKSAHKYRLGAVIFRKKKMISSGYNIAYKYIHPHELPAKYRKYPSGIHAEMAALLSARCNVKGASILVVRINSKGTLRDSFPCKFCLMYLKYVGIRKVIYSTSQQEIKEYLL